MKPVAIFRHARTEGPGYFGDYLDQREIAWRLIQIDQGEPVPATAHLFSGLCFMGGPMSVNDPLPWISQVLQLIRAAVDQCLPVIGHCLGGQLMSKALGGTVEENLIKEIGWGRVEVLNASHAKSWLGDVQGFEAFHWHGETFSIPAGAQRIALSEHCVNQMFVYDDRHVAMQFHVEMTPELIDQWCDTGAKEIAASTSPAVMQVPAVKERMAERVAALHAIADRIYNRWSVALR